MRFLATSRQSRIVCYTGPHVGLDAVIALCAALQKPHRALDIEAMPTLLLPLKERLGLTGHEKVFCPDVASGIDIFDMRDIDRAKRCFVNICPDQSAAHVLPLGAPRNFAAFFDTFMLDNPRKRQIDAIESSLPLDADRRGPELCNEQAAPG